TEEHEPQVIRERMTEVLRDERIPPVSWRYRELEELTPAYGQLELGSPALYRASAETVGAAWARSGSAVWGAARFERDLGTFLELVPEREE
ncbi:MAG TPA: hypothetical protein DEA08_17955, partial [Planctomycetes bacterium]|nr:hypothetical protein [Planctomycetota bacterium]